MLLWAPWAKRDPGGKWREGELSYTQSQNPGEQADGRGAGLSMAGARVTGGLGMCVSGWAR